MKAASQKGDEEPSKPHDVHKGHPPNEKIKSETTRGKADKINLNFATLQTNISIPIPKKYSGKNHPPVEDVVVPPPQPVPPPEPTPPPPPIQAPPAPPIEQKPKEEPNPEDIFNPDTFIPSNIEVRIPLVNEKNRSILTKLNTPRADVPPLESPKFLEKVQHIDITTVAAVNPPKSVPQPPVTNLQMLLQTANKTIKPVQKVQKKVVKPPPIGQPIVQTVVAEPPKEVSFPQLFINAQNQLLNPTPAAVAAVAAARTIQAQKLVFPFQIQPKQEAEQKPQIQAVCAAPNPILPQASEIRTLIDETDTEIAKLKQTIADLNREMELACLSAPSVSEIKTETAVQNYHGFLIPHNPIEVLRRENSGYIQKSHSNNIIQAKNTKYLHIAQLPEYQNEMNTQENYLNPMLRVVLEEKTLLRTKKVQLAWEYKQRNAPWNELNNYISVYNHESHGSIDLWPPEFALNKLKTTDKSILLPLCAPDQPMLLSDSDKQAELYYDENSFVENPEYEHLMYKKRITWTESEKQIFLDKYAQHPRQFKKIAAALPLKSVKDVIEYYYINRIKLNLKELEKIVHSRGRKRAILSERFQK